MKLFLHTSERIRIINGDLEWSGSPAEFLIKEPDYPGLPTLSEATAAIRYQTPDVQYIEDTTGVRHPDLFDALPYCDTVSTYLANDPAVYVHIVMSVPLLIVNDPESCINAEITIRGTADPNDPALPLTATWPINLRSKNGLVIDNILIPFADGVALIAYYYQAGLPLGEYRIDESDFDRIDMGGMMYQVKMVNALRFTVTRQLPEV